MQEVAIVTDSIACLPKELVERYGIRVVSIRLLIQGKVYRDLVDITPTQAYEFLDQDPDRFNTSPASPGHFLEVYREASSQAKQILCITLSSKLSTGYEMARIARDEARSELGDTEIHVMDSETVTAAEGFIALAAAREAAAGKDFEAVIRAAEEVRSKVFFIGLLETMKHVYRTGRIPKMAANIGSMLRIRPMLTCSSGAIHLMGIVRNREHGVKRILETMKRKMGDGPVHVAVMHASAPDDAEALMERVADEFNCTELWTSEFSPVMGYATGTGTLAVAFYRD